MTGSRLTSGLAWRGGRHASDGAPVGFVSYGADGGVRAVEHWRTSVANFQMVGVRAQVALGLFTDFGDDGLAPLDRRPAELAGMLDQLVPMTGKLRG